MAIPLRKEGKKTITMGELRWAKTQLDQAIRINQNGDKDEAIKICTSVVRDFPKYFAAIETLGQLHLQKGNLKEARKYLYEGVVLYPNSWRAQLALAKLYSKYEAWHMVIQTAKIAKELEPMNSEVSWVLAVAYYNILNYEQAEIHAHDCFTLNPSHDQALSFLGKTKAHLGKSDEFVELFESEVSKVKLSPDLISTYLEASPGKISPKYAKKIENTFNDAKSNGTKSKDHKTSFARARYLNFLGDYEAAWDEVVIANELKSKLEDITPEESVKEAENSYQKTLMLAQDEWKPAEGGDPVPLSLFILGPSRSGKTSLEKVISAHPGFAKGYENSNLQEAALNACNELGVYPSGNLELFPTGASWALGKTYKAIISRIIGDAQAITTTTPGQIFEVPFIYRLLPNSKFIFMKRNHSDLIAKIYFKSYANKNYYSYDVAATSEYIKIFDAQIDLLKEKLGDDAMVFDFESLVQAPSQVCSQILEFCGMQGTDLNIEKIGNDVGFGLPYQSKIDEVLKRRHL